LNLYPTRFLITPHSVNSAGKSIHSYELLLVAVRAGLLFFVLQLQNKSEKLIITINNFNSNTLKYISIDIYMFLGDFSSGANPPTESRSNSKVKKN